MNDSTSQAYRAQNNSSWLRSLGAELAFTQDASGCYRSFYWAAAQEYGLDWEAIADSQVSDLFKPLTIAPYLERVARVLESLIPERFSYPFRYADRYFLFELVISPILLSTGDATEVLVMGRLLPNALSVGDDDEPGSIPQVISSQLDLHQKLVSTILGSIRRTLPPGSELYQKLLGEMARKIRRSLDLNSIWQATVKDLGVALSVRRCAIFPYKSGAQTVQAIAEYLSEPLHPLQGRDLSLTEHPYLLRALETRAAIVVEPDEAPELEPHSILVVTTSYQERPNALIYLDRSGISASDGGDRNAASGQQRRSQVWSVAEIELLHELAEQVGTAIAHATLYQELEDARKQAEEASRLKSQFLANTSHELRTPLNGTLGFLKLIMDGMAEDEEERQEFLREAYTSAVHLLNLINDILDIAKIEAGKMELDLSPVNLDEVLMAIENHTRAQVQQKQLSFQIHTQPTEDDIVLYGNYQRLLQVMLNLVGNAIKFTHEGGITITVELLEETVMVQEREFPGLVKVAVADTGIGVSLDKQDKLFQSFSQVDGERTRQYGGTGLGLAISQKLIEAMGGTVNFYSMGEGLGSTVTFTAPLYQKPILVSTAIGDAIDLLI